jgi:hypothetical protein
LWNQRPYEENLILRSITGVEGNLVAVLVGIHRHGVEQRRRSERMRKGEEAKERFSGFRIY